MSEIFSDLKDLGLDGAKSLKLFDEEEVEKVPDEPTNRTKVIKVEDLLYTAKQECPVCRKVVHYRAVKSGKVRLVKSDLDLRPIYEGFDPSLYEVVCCNLCGYAALRKQFTNNVTPKKADLIKKNVSAQFVGRTYPDIYNYDIAIERYKLALYDAMVMEGKDSEKAYLCLKIAWLYRGYVENELDDSDKIENCRKNEVTFLQHALDGFKIAHYKESFPTMGLDLLTVKFLIGELSRRLGHTEEALKWISEVIVSKTASRRLKERALECKELLKKEKSN